MSSLNYVYPTAYEMYQVNSDLTQRIQADDPTFKLFPDKTTEAFEVRWWQKDNAYGLMNMRGIDGRPGPVQRLGSNEFVHAPGVYGDYTTITEGEILKRAIPGNQNQVMDVTAMTMDAANLLTIRRENRKKANIWTLLSTGVLNIPIHGPAGPTIYSVVYPIQTYTAPISWKNLSTATILANLQTVQQKSVGHGARFDSGSTLYINQVGANYIVNNSNTADLAGKRNVYGSTFNNIGDNSNYFQGNNLPGIQVLDDFYQNQPVAGPVTNASTQVTKYLPDGVAVLVGTRPNNEPVGHTLICPSANNPNNAPGNYSFVKNYGLGINAPQEVPARLEIHDGFNGGHALEFPSAVVAIYY
jgi:hypothetical protein